jgi:hypothetical protein
MFQGLIDKKQYRYAGPSYQRNHRKCKTSGKGHQAPSEYDGFVVRSSRQQAREGTDGESLR